MTLENNIETKQINKQINSLSVDAFTNFYCTFNKYNTKIYAYFHFLFNEQISNSNKLRLEVQNKLYRANNCNKPMQEDLAGSECPSVAPLILDLQNTNNAQHSKTIANAIAIAPGFALT